MNSRFSLLFLTLTILLVIPTIHGKFVHKKIKTNEPWIYLDKFCFDTTGNGTLKFTVLSFSPQSAMYSNGGVSLLTYYDSNNGGSWDHVRKDKSLQHCKGSIPVQLGHPTTVLFGDTKRPHYWYIALGSCSGETIEMEYTMEFEQHEEGLNRQFSFDEQGLLPTYAVFFSAFFIALCINLYGDFELVRARSFHPIMKLLSISLALMTLSFMTLMIHNIIYSHNGVGSPFLKTVGELFDMTSTLLFMLLLILIAKGWGISFPALSYIQDQRLILLGIFSAFFTAYVVLFFWGLYGVDPASTMWLYQSTPGIVYLVVRVLTFLYFVYCLVKTLKEDPDTSKKMFYMMFGMGYTVWFLGLPIVVVISNSSESWAWYRMKVVIAIYSSLTAFAFSLIGYLLWPTRAAKYFQVAVPDLTSGGYETL